MNAVRSADGNRRALAQRIGGRTLPQVTAATIVVLPSLTHSEAELRRTPASESLEERLLFTLLLLRDPDVRIVYVTSLAVDQAIVDYHLRYVPDAADARHRLAMVTLDEPGPRGLTHKLLQRPDAVQRIRDHVTEPERAYLLCYKVTPAEHALAAQLDLPLDGPHPDLLELGTKSGSRRAARAAGVPILDGQEQLRSVADVERALTDLRERRPTTRAALVKLEDSHFGRGNAIVELQQPLSPLTGSAATFVYADENWQSYAARIGESGAIVEEYLDCPSLVSSCVQLRISPTGVIELLSVHDMILDGNEAQRYAGCRYPADPRHRTLVRDAGLRIAHHLADEGVHGWFGVDFIVDPTTAEPRCFLCEINLRMGGGNHPFWLATLASGAAYDPASEEIRAGGRLKSYVASDQVHSPQLVGMPAATIIERVDSAGLTFDPGSGRGVMLQFISAATVCGTLGVTCIADDLDDADELKRDVIDVLAVAP